jgi:tripartite-type tricarboxylate transporter receptor subunit TctC
VPNVLVVRNSLPVNSVAELVAYAKTHPGKLSYGSQGVGTTSQLSFKLLEKLAGIEMVHVPYRGEVPVLNDIIAGNIDLFFGTMSTSAPMYKAKQLKALAVGSLQRSPFLPDVPTVAEQGYPSFQSIAWFAMAGPPNMPESIAGKISKDVDRILNDPSIRDKLKSLMLEPVGGTTAETAKFFISERALWGQVIKDAGLQPQDQ